MGDLARALVARSRNLAATIAVPYASANRTYTVTITRPGTEPTFDRTTGEWVGGSSTTVYTGPAHVRPVAGGPADTGEDEPVYQGRTDIDIDRGAGEPRIDDIVTVDTDPDGDLTGRQFRVVDVAVGGFISTGYTLVCAGVEPSRWNP